MPASNKKNHDFTFFLFIPGFYLNFIANVSFVVMTHKMFGEKISAPLSLAIFAASVYLLRRYVLGELRKLEWRGGYYVAEDSAAGGGGKILNACVPLAPGLDAVVVSKSLLEALGDKELEAVLKHEEGHIRYRHALFITTALAAFYLTYHDILKALDAYLGSPAALLPVGLAVGFALGLLLINTTLRSLEREADHYAVVNGYSEELKNALSKIPQRPGLLSRLLDPHPLYHARAGVIEGLEEPSWHIRVIAAPVFLISLAYVAYFAQHLAGHVSVAVVITLGPALVFTAFLIALFTAYVVLYMHRALGVELWNSRVVILAYYLGTLITMLHGLGEVGLIATALTAPLLASRGLREYFALLAPLLIATALNFATVIFVHSCAYKVFPRLID